MAAVADTKRPLLIADLFCGAGGSSTGAVRALGRLGLAHELVCVNHWAVAIDTHAANHPEARHHCVDIGTARPEVIVPEGYLDLLMASPTCTYHSRARGGKPTSDQQRMDPWHVVTWCTSLRVERIMIENVPEFMQWGPVDPETGRPDPSRRGEFFGAWLSALRAIGYNVECRVLNCADHGDPTTRERFFLLGRRDGGPITWPRQSHARPDGAAAMGKPGWRAAREIIDWSLASESIFTRARPLKPKTLARIAAGLSRFGAAAEPFLVVLRNHADARDLDLPLPAITAGGSHFGLVEPVQPIIVAQQSGGLARPVSRPMATIPALGAHALVEPLVMAYYGANASAKPVSQTLDTVTTRDRFGLVEPVAGPPVDIRYRMLQPHELAGAMSFPGDYRFSGTKTDIKRQIGNAVPVRTADALVTASFGVAA